MIILPFRNTQSEGELPPVTISLILINTVLFLFIYRMGLLQSYDFLYSWGFSWYLFHPTTLLTTQFLHANFVHLAGNILFLWLFGPRLEDELGEGLFLSFYVTGGIVATLVYSLTLPDYMVDQPLIGASGAIAAVMGMYFVLFPKSRIKHFFFLLIRYWTFTLPAWITLGYWFLLQVYNTHVSAASPVAYYAHIGGFLFGFGLGFYYKTSNWYRPSFEDLTDMNAVRKVHDINNFLDEPAQIMKFEEAIEQQPDNPELAYWYAVTTLRQGKVQRAQKVARNITDRYPDDYKRPKLNAFLLHHRLGESIQEPDEALFYAKLLEDIDKYEVVVDYLGNYLEESSLSTAAANRVRMRLGRILVDHLERYEEARDLFAVLDHTASDRKIRKMVDRKKRKLETYLDNDRTRDSDRTSES